MTSPPAPDPRRARVRIGVGAAVLVALAALAAAAAGALLGPAGSSTTVSPSRSPSATAAPSGRSSAPAADTFAAPGDTGALYVHVVGHVVAPGLYRLAAGSRVIDAVAAAGGLAGDGDAAAVNLARPLSDGEQLVIPAVGEAPPAAAAGSGGAGGSAAAGGTSAAGGKVDLNTATVEQLDALPHIGPALAQRILDWRSTNGPFGSVDDLRAVTGIGDKTFADLKDLVTV